MKKVEISNVFDNRIIKYFAAIFLVVFLWQNSFSKDLKIISLAPSVTKQIYLLEAQDQLVGVTGYCKVAKPDHKEIVAASMSVNTEKIVSLQPDVIVTTNLTKSKELNLLEKLGFKLVVLPSPSGFDEICDQFIEIGKVIGKEMLAKNIVEEQKIALSNLQTRIPSGKILDIFIEIGAKPLWTATGNTFMHDYIVQLGGKNIAEGMKSGSIGRESVLLKNPDVIIIVTMGMVAKEEKETWQKYKQLNAVKNNKIFIVDADKCCSPTPVSFREVVEELVNKIYN